jgi:hypothetical protein
VAAFAPSLLAPAGNAESLSGFARSTLFLSVPNLQERRWQTHVLAVEKLLHGVWKSSGRNQRPIQHHVSARHSQRFSQIIGRRYFAHYHGRIARFHHGIQKARNGSEAKELFRQALSLFLEIVVLGTLLQFAWCIDVAVFEISIKVK